MKQLLFLSLISLTTIIKAQGEWENHVAISGINDIETYDSLTYVACRAGLLIINTETGEEELFYPANSSLNCAGVNEIEVLSNGHAWISARNDYEGLFYYDGQDFEHHYIIDTGDTLKAIRNLSSVNENELWFTSYEVGNAYNINGVLYSYIDGVFTNYSSDFSDGVSTIGIDTDSNLWVHSGGHIYKYDGANFNLELSLPSYFHDTTVVDKYFIDSDDVHWIHSYDRNTRKYFLLKIYDSGWSNYPLPSYLYNFLEDDDGIALSFAYQSGYVFDNQVRLDSTSNLYPQVSTDYNFVVVREIDEDNGKWLSSYEGDDGIHIYHVKDGITTTYGHNDSFRLVYTYSMVKDCNGDILAADDGVVEKYVDGDWSSIYPEYKFEDCEITHLAVNQFTCEVWGFSNRIDCKSLWRFSEEKIIEIPISPGGIDNLSFDEKGNVYLSTFLNAIKIDTVGLQTIYDSNNSPILFVLDNHYSTNGSLWVTAYDTSQTTSVLEFRDDQWYTYNHLNTPLSSDEFSYLMYEDPLGNMWFEGQIGLVKYDGSTWQEFPMDFEKSNTYVVDMVMRSDGSYWLATSREGLFHWKDNVITSYNNLNSDIFSNRCNAIELVDDDYIWIGHYNALSRLMLNEVSSTQDQPTALHESPPQFTVYPNPSSGIFNIKNETTGKRKYEVYNLNGELIISETSDRETWSQSLESGVYIIKVITENSEAVEKLIIL